MANYLLGIASTHQPMCQCLGIREEEGSALCAVRETACPTSSRDLMFFFFRYTLSGQNSAQRIQGNSP